MAPLTKISSFYTIFALINSKIDDANYVLRHLFHLQKGKYLKEKTLLQPSAPNL